MKNNKFVKRISTLSILGILEVSVLSGSLNTFAANNYIGVEKAKSIALKDAGVSGATFVKAKLETEDGVKVYDVEFYKANVEYDYEIDAITGKILEKDLDIENFSILHNRRDHGIVDRLDGRPQVVPSGPQPIPKKGKVL